MERPPLLAIAVLSATALGYEILLIRLFSVIQWHHFAYMIISLALLGYGASGTFLAFTQARLLSHYRTALLSNLALFGLSAMPIFLLVQQIPFNPDELLWDWREPLRLMLIYLLLSLPFFFTANAIALTLANFRQRITRVYAVDLLGAGIGSLAVIGLLYLVAPLQTLSLVSALGLACVAISAWELRIGKRLWISIATLPAVAAVVWLGQVATLSPSPYKSLSQSLRITGAELVAERYNPLGLSQVLRNSAVPLRYAPGMSVNSSTGPPEQLGIFIDGNGIGAITRDSGDRQSMEFLDQLTSALPYHLHEPRRVLIPGAGGGMDVLQALYQGASEIHAIELNPQIVELVRDEFADFSGRLYQHPAVRIHVAESRGFVAKRDMRYDLIQHTLEGSSGGSGLFALSENYLYTVEALQLYLQRLSRDGYLAISQWVKLPPRDTLKLFATVVQALRRAGVDDPGRRLLLIRGWQTSTLLVKNGAISPREIRAMRDFARARSFDVAWYPGMQRDEANRYNILREPYFYQAAEAMLGPDSEGFMDRYKFRLQPASDDKPYFHNFFKWSTLEEILSLRGQGGMPLLEAGYLVLLATFVQALLLSLLLILLPLKLLKHRHAGATTGVSRWRVVVYFGAIGLAFLFLEIALIQKFMMFLHHPLFTASVVLASFLVFAGLGSKWSQRHSKPDGYRPGVRLAVGGIVLAGVAYLLALDTLFNWLLGWPMLYRICISIALIAPLAFCMGMPFPLALSSLGQRATAMIPLAWGVNGCASVMSAVLATLLAINFGFTAVVVLALLLYILAASSFPAESG